MISLKKIKRVIVAIIGSTILLIGLILLVLPGPAFIVIPIGLGILATEFVWARKILDKVKNTIRTGKDKFKKKPETT